MALGPLEQNKGQREVTEIVPQKKPYFPFQCIHTASKPPRVLNFLWGIPETLEVVPTHPSPPHVGSNLIPEV